MRVLTRRDRVYQFPAWSPDGSVIAAVGSDRGGVGVYCFQDLAEGEQWQLYRSEVGSQESPFYLYWSPDSRQVSFLANHPVGGIGFHVVKREPKPSDNLLAFGQPFFWQWGQNSAEIFIHTGIGDAGRLSIIDPTKEPEATPNIATPGYFQTPGFSADEQYLAYCALDDAGARLVIEQRRTHKRITKQQRGGVALSWSPTSNHLAFMAPNDDTTHFYGPLSLVTTSGKVTRLSADPILAFFWSPDGKKIAYFSPTREQPASPDYSGGSRYGIARSVPQLVDVAEATQLQQQEIIRLDCWIVDLRLRTRQKLLNFQPTRLFLNQFLPFFDQYALSHRIWSPSNDALVLPKIADGKSEITVVTLESEQSTVIGEGYMGFWSCQ